MGPVFLLHLVVDLLVVGDEIKRPVALERTAQREPKLILGKVGVESLDLARR